MNQYNNRAVEQYSNRIGVTLLELLIAIALLSVIVIGFSSIDIFSRYHVLSSDRRAKLQNEVSYALEHMSKEIARAIGNEVIDRANSVVNTGVIGSDTAIRVYIDTNATGGPGDGIRDTTNDRWIAYRLNGNQIWYCPQYNTTTAACTPAWGTADNILSRQITNFTATKPGGNTLSDNFVNINLTARWQPSQAASPDNPEVTMRTRIKMPGVSTN